MTKENLEKVGFLTLIGTLIFLWAAIQISGVRSREHRREQCRILDIELKEDDFSEQDRPFCRVVIHMDQKVSYTITEQEGDSAFMVELPHATVPVGLDLETLSNDLVQKIRIQHLDTGPVMVGLDLASSQIFVVDRTKNSADGASMIDLELKYKEQPSTVSSLAQTGSEGAIESEAAAARKSEIVLVSMKSNLNP